MHKVFLRLPDSWSNWNLEMLVFEERGRPEYPEKNFSEQREDQQQTLFAYTEPGGIVRRGAPLGLVAGINFIVNGGCGGNH